MLEWWLSLVPGVDMGMLDAVRGGDREAFCRSHRAAVYASALSDCRLGWRWRHTRRAAAAAAVNLSPQTGDKLVNNLPDKARSPRQHWLCGRCCRREAAAQPGSKLQRRLARRPGGHPDHHRLELAAGGPALQPAARVLPAAAGKPVGVDGGELAHERKDGGIGQAGDRAAEHRLRRAGAPRAARSAPPRPAHAPSSRLHPGDRSGYL